MGGPNVLRDQLGDQLAELDSVVGRLLSDVERVRTGEVGEVGVDLGPGSFAAPSADSTTVAGGSGQAQEDRAVRRSWARDAQGRGQMARETLAELSRRVGAGADRIEVIQGHRPDPESGAGYADRLRAAMDAVVVEGDPGAVVASVAAAVLGFDGVAHATVCLRGPDRAPRLTAGSDEVGTTLAEIQDRVGQGPCVQVAETGRAVRVDDICSPRSPWPIFGAAAAGLGVIGVVAVPLRAATATGTAAVTGSGSLTLWTRRGDEVTGALVALAELFARYAGLAIVVAGRTGPAADPRG